MIFYPFRVGLMSFGYSKVESLRQCLPLSTVFTGRVSPSVRWDTWMKIFFICLQRLPAAGCSVRYGTESGFDRGYFGSVKQLKGISMKYSFVFAALLIGLALSACGSKTVVTPASVVPTGEPGKAGGETPLVIPAPTQAR
jgi:hypothetical protein